MRVVGPKAVDQTAVPPNSDVAERALLCGIILAGQEAHFYVDEAAFLIAPDDFYQTKHEQVFHAMLSLRRNNDAIDLTTVEGRMPPLDTAEQRIRRISFLNGLTEAGGYPESVVTNAERVRKLSVLRTVILRAQAFAAEAYGEPDDAEAFLGRVTTSYSLIALTRTPGAKTMADVCAEVAHDVDAAQRAGLSSTAWSTGIPRLDEATGGLYAGELVIVCGRPGTGKTVAMMTMAEAAAEESGLWSLVCSLEMRPKDLVCRMISSVSGMDGRYIRSGRMSPAQEMGVYTVLNRLASKRIAFLAGAQSPQKIRAAARRQKTTTGLCGVFIDYLGLMDADEKGEREDITLGSMTRSLKLMAGELDVPTVLLAQLNRKVEDRESGRIKASDLRGSGRIEEDADTIYGMSRNRETSPRILDIDILKGRSMGDGHVQVGFDPERTRIVDELPTSAPAHNDRDYKRLAGGDA